MKRRFIPWRVRHVNLAGSRDEWTLDGEGEGIFVVFWTGDIPLGRAWLDPNELPLSAEQVAELAARVVAPTVGYWTLGDCFSPNYPASAQFNESRRGGLSFELLDRVSEPLRAVGERGDPAGDVVARRPSLSVIVCTRDRPDSLARCLEALLDSSEPADEIIVVDNAPQGDETRSVTERFAGVRYVLEPVAGLSRARNTGVRAAKGELIAFTDDDVEVHPRWTMRVRSSLSDGRHAAMTGLVLPASLEHESEYLFEAKFGGFSQGFRPMVYDRDFVESTVAWGVPVWRIGAGANMAFRRDALDVTGGFDERLGAGRAGCSEDSELWYRMLRAGLSCVYEPRAVVAHRHRGDLRGLRRQMRAYTRGHVAALLAQFERTGDWGNVKRIAITLPKYYLGRLMGRLTTVAVPTTSTYVDEVAGSLAGIGYYLRHRRSAGAPALGEGRSE